MHIYTHFVLVLDIRKQLRSHHSITTSENLNRLKYHTQLFLDLWESRANCLFQNWRDRLMSIGSHILPKSLMVGNDHGNQCPGEWQNCNWWIAEDLVWTSLRVKNVKEGYTFLRILCPEASSGSHSKCYKKKKISSCIQQEQR